MRTWTLLVCAALALSAAGANCIPPIVNPPPDDGPRDALLKGFESPDEMRSFLASQAAARYQNTGGTGGGWWLFPVFGAAAPSMEDDAAGDAEGGGRGYSTTNIQEVGVDESDIIKNNGEYIYMLGGDKVHVLKATPPESMAEVATLTVAAGGSSMYLRDNTLVVVSQQYGYYYDGGWGWAVPMDDGGRGGASSGSADAAMIAPPWDGRAQSTVALLDVTDPAHPAPIKEFQFEGTIVNSRLIGGKLHLVMQADPVLPDDPTVQNIEAMTLEAWVPDVRIAGPDGTVISSGDVADWQGSLRPEDPNGYGMTVIATLDLDNPDAALKTTAVTANVGTIYASTEALYLTDTQYAWDTQSARTDTMIHKLVFTDEGTDYVASGLVPGRPLNSYSMGEFGGHLRIATTNEQFLSWTSQSLSSGVYVLGVNGTALQTVGKIENIAPGEQIYAARFIGDRGFLVTFRRVDPLFTMDLSDPADPKIVGELKVPGYSDHIQLLDANHLLTIGRETEEADDWAWVQGVLLTIFDVTDLANPKILMVGETPARVEIGGRGTYSDANHDPKAFNYFAEKNALAFPINLYDGDTTGAEYGQHAFTGLYVYRVTAENGFEFLGRIASAEGPTQNNCFQGYYGPTRGVFIGDYVYSVTETGAKAAPLAAVSTIAGEVTFTGAPAPVLDCFWSVPELALPPSADLR